jgi:hypothetical protein
MWIDAAWHDVLAAGVDKFGVRRCGQFRPDLLDLAVATQHVSLKSLFRSYDRSTFD